MMVQVIQLNDNLLFTVIKYYNIGKVSLDIHILIQNNQQN